MNTTVEFKSDLFKPFLPDEAQVNPGVYGAELAYWLSKRLSEAGVMTSYPCCEDWGWFIEFQSEKGEEYWLCCGNVVSDNVWRCFLDAKKSSLFGRKAGVENASLLLEAVAKILESESRISDIVWSSE